MGKDKDQETWEEDDGDSRQDESEITHLGIVHHCDPDLDRAHFIRVRDEERPQVLIPEAEESSDRQDDEEALSGRDENREDVAKSSASIHQSRFVESSRKAEEGLAQEQDLGCTGKERQDDPRIRVEETKFRYR